MAAAVTAVHGLSNNMKMGIGAFLLILLLFLAYRYFNKPEDDTKKLAKPVEAPPTPPVPEKLTIKNTPSDWNKRLADDEWEDKINEVAVGALGQNASIVIKARMEVIRVNTAWMDNLKPMSVTRAPTGDPVKDLEIELRIAALREVISSNSIARKIA
jgi:hypothetical protein